jgi:serine/threonine-protein kinase ATR
MRILITQAQKLTEQLLGVCEGAIQTKASAVSLSKDLGFVHKCAPCGLVVPLEKTLMASLTSPDTVKGCQPFSREAVTIFCAYARRLASAVVI